jgi:hypothetical protein
LSWAEPVKLKTIGSSFARSWAARPSLLWIASEVKTFDFMLFNCFEFSLLTEAFFPKILTMSAPSDFGSVIRENNIDLPSSDKLSSFDLNLSLFSNSALQKIVI